MCPAWVSNALPLRVRVDPAMTVHELLRQVSGELHLALRHQRYRYEDLHRDLGLTRDRRPSGVRRSTC